MKKSGCILMIVMVGLAACSNAGDSVTVKTDSLDKTLDTLGNQIDKKAAQVGDSVNAKLKNLKESVNAGLDSIK